MMDILNDIRSFLESGRDFDEGLALLSQVEVNRGIVAFISRKRDMAALRYHLARRLRIPPRRLVIQHTATPAGRKAEEQVSSRPAARQRRTRREDLPAELHPVYDGIVEAYKEQRSMHEKMKLLSEQGNDSAAAEVREQLLALDRRIRDGWASIDESLDSTSDGDREQTDTAGQTGSPTFNINSHRSYITKALAKENLSDTRKSEVIKRVKDLLDHSVPISDKIVEKLRARGLWPG